MALSTQSTRAEPHLECGECQMRVPLQGKRVGDSIRCSSCQALVVITRSKAKGDVPPQSIRAGGMTHEERAEVADCLRRIKNRRIGRAARHVTLYPSWLVLMTLGQFYLSGILAGLNIAAVGQGQRGRKMQIGAIVAYLLCGVIFLVAAFTVGPELPFALNVAALAGVPLAFGGYYAWAQHTACGSARDAGAENASVVLPLLLGMILAIAQAFAVWFLKLHLQGPV